MSTVIKVEGLGKQYRLGLVNSKTLSSDVSRFFAKLRGKEDPTLQIGVSNDRTQKGGDYVWALKDVDFEVKQGEVLGIIGKNGAGKSTLLKILSRVTRPTLGEIKVKGRIASLLEVGTGFHPELTGRENIFLNGAILGMSKAEIKSKFDEIVEFSGVAKYIDTPVKRYSSGMYVRLAFAVAAHLEPEILIVDEVLAVGDAEFQKKCMGKMKDVAGQGRTVLFVSHNIELVSMLCTQGLVMTQGKVVFDGTAKAAVEQYVDKLSDVVALKDLESVPRSGMGGLRFVGFEILNALGKPINEVEMGTGVTFAVKIQTKDGSLLEKEMEVALVFKTKDGLRLFTLASIFKSKKIAIGSEKTVFFTIERFPVPEGIYFCDLYVAENKFAVHDYVQDVVTVSVFGNDFYKQGNAQHPGHDKFFVDFDIKT